MLSLFIVEGIWWKLKVCCNQYKSRYFELHNISLHYYFVLLKIPQKLICSRWNQYKRLWIFIIVCLSGFENFISYSLMRRANTWAKTLNSACLCEKSAVYCLCYYKTLILIASMKTSHNNLRSLSDKSGVLA